MCVTFIVHMCGMIHSHVWHGLFTTARYLISELPTNLIDVDAGVLCVCVCVWVLCGYVCVCVALPHFGIACQSHRRGRGRRWLTSWGTTPARYACTAACPDHCGAWWRAAPLLLWHDRVCMCVCMCGCMCVWLDLCGAWWRAEPLLMWYDCVCICLCMCVWSDHCDAWWRACGTIHENYVRQK